MATATNTDVGAGAPQNVPAPQQDLSWTKGDFKITLFGAVRLDAYYNSARTQGARYFRLFCFRSLPADFRSRTYL